jgi:phosphoribosylglycinamide formyltransferase-1
VTKPRILVLASGSKEGGGSGFENLVEHSRAGSLHAEIVAVASNHANGGVRKRAERLRVPFVHLCPSISAGEIVSWPAERYQRVAQAWRAEWVVLSGWLKHVKGLDPRTTFNIHPALLSSLSGRFGGRGMYGHRVHEAVAASLARGEILETGVTMHFVTEEYDRGPPFFEYRVPLAAGASAEEIAVAVNAIETTWQPKITDLVVNGAISWHDSGIIVPNGYQYLPRGSPQP